jgi:hypothetical protein
MSRSDNAVLFVLMTLMMIPNGLAAQENTAEHVPCLVIFFVDMSDFMCLNCLDSLLEICLLFPKKILSERALVVLMEDGEPGDPTGKKINIVLKKARALFRANNLSVPFCCDSAGLFKELRKKADIVVFDTRSQKIKVYSLPLSRPEVWNILDSLSH